jgi:RND superfamily putative drug exporter
MTRRHWIVAAWVVVVALLAPFAPRAASTLQVAATSERSEAARVDRLLSTRFGSALAAYAVLVVHGVSVTDSVGREVVGDIAFELGDSPSVTRVLSYGTLHDSMFVSPNATFLIVGLRADPPPRESIVGLRALTSALLPTLRARVPSLELEWTGAPAIDRDVRMTSSADAAAAERRVLPITLFLLVVLFGSVVAAALPVVSGALAIILTLGAVALLARIWTLTILTQNVVSMIGLGLGIDYGLLTVSRFREALARGLSPDDAAAFTRRSAGHTVLLSGLAVAIGFAPLLLIPAAELRSIALGGLLVTVASLLLATTLLPAVLAWLGHRVDLGRVRRTRSGTGGLAVWRHWGRTVTHRPVTTLVVAGVPLVLLAAQALRVNASIPRGLWLPPNTESTRGVVAMRDMGHAALIQTIRVVVELPADADGRTERGWLGVAALARTLGHDPRIARTRSLPQMFHVDVPTAEELGVMPADLRSGYQSSDARLMLIELEPTEAASPSELVHLVREIRGLNPDSALANHVTGARLLVGGLPGFNADYQDAIGGSLVHVISVVIVGTLLALFIGFRSVLVPLKAVILNLLSVAAAMGATVLVFQDGHGARLFGLAAPLDGVFPAVPIIVFCVVFGLSMDYEVFLVDRVREGIRQGDAPDDALVDALAHTGGVITSAALVMIVVFGGFAAGDFLIIKILGFALAVAVFLDATLVRMAVGPALLKLAGAWNWWPGVRRPSGR